MKQILDELPRGSPWFAPANRYISRSFQRATGAVGTVMGFGVPDEDGGLVVEVVVGEGGGWAWRVSALARGHSEGGSRDGRGVSLGNVTRLLMAKAVG